MHFDFNLFNATMNEIMPFAAALVLVTAFIAVFSVMIYLVVASAWGLIGRIYRRLRWPWLRN